MGWRDWGSLIPPTRAESKCFKNKTLPVYLLSAFKNWRSYKKNPTNSRLGKFYQLIIIFFNPKIGLTQFIFFIISYKKMLHNRIPIIKKINLSNEGILIGIIR